MQSKVSHSVITNYCLCNEAWYIGLGQHRQRQIQVCMS